MLMSVLQLFPGRSGEHFRLHAASAEGGEVHVLSREQCIGMRGRQIADLNIS